MRQLWREAFIALPPHDGSVLNERLKQLSAAFGFNPNIVQRVPDSWTAMALVGAEVGVSLTVSSVAENIVDKHVRFVEISDRYELVQLRMAWQKKSDNPALAAVLKAAEKVWH